MSNPRQPRGFIALVTVLVLMTVLLAIGLTVAAIGRDEIVLSGVVQDGDQAFFIADACVEEAIARFKDDGAYAGGTYALSGGTCVVTVTNLGGNDRLVHGDAAYVHNVRGIDANVTLKLNNVGNAKTVKINSWLESS